MNYNDIGLVPRLISNIDSRSKVDTSIEFAGMKLSIPLIASPMPDVCDGNMARILAENGAYGFIHRFMTIEEQAIEFSLALKQGSTWNVLPTLSCGCAIGITDDYLDRFQTLYLAGCRSFCIDVANGANILTARAIENVLSLHNNIYLTVGNVASLQCFNWLAKLPGVYAIRCGIAGGQVCSTKIETGICRGMVNVIYECDRWRQNQNVLLIADSGIKTPGDMCKALALGADAVMVGSLLASSIDSPANTLKIDGKIMKVCRGAASFSVQQNNGKTPQYVEGLETLIPIATNVSKILSRFKKGIQSSMSYMDASNLSTYRENVSICKL